MKIQFRISRNQLMVWLYFLETRWIEPGKNGGAYSRMVYHALSDLLHKLKVQSVIEKPTYKFSISAVSGLAFMVFCEFASKYPLDRADEAIINDLIGKIDRQTIQ
ncbi:hypothetical protein ACF3OC_07875 [Sphingobacterium cellulitidis]|uniref:hypothetical protein n=1 Tax=Sphingobacterium cellulitidis TaxID=1768011 RepID=UPI00370D1509